MTEPLFPYVVISVAAKGTGLSVAAIEKKIAAGHWLEGAADSDELAKLEIALESPQKRSVE